VALIIEYEHQYKDAADLRTQTITTIICDSVNGEPAEISLASAIDRLEAYHRDFVRNLSIILKAIGGELKPTHPYAACGRNIKLSPLRPRMKIISETLRSFWDDEYESSNLDDSILVTLGAKTPEKRWLAASLNKTIRVQLGL
jgi:hypothetical protein